MNSNQCVFFKQNLFCTINDRRFALFCGKSIRLFIGKISAAKNFIHWANDWRLEGIERAVYKIDDHLCRNFP